MNLFQKYQSRALQFSIDVLSALVKKQELSESEVDALARKNYLAYSDQVMQSLYEAELILPAERGCKVPLGQPSFRFPLGRLELDYLQYILRLPEASLFLEEGLREKLEKKLPSTDFFSPVQGFAPQGESEFNFSMPNCFRKILQAIRQGRRIRYEFCTQREQTLQKSEALPWKLEFSSYDRRWWVILYLAEEKRTVKACLKNLRNIELLGEQRIPQETILDAVDRLLAPEPIVIEVRKEMGAVERCFMVFEHQPFVETEQLPGDLVRMVFRYYRFDEEEILRRLLYLGPMVSLRAPIDLRLKLSELLEQALLV